MSAHKNHKGNSTDNLSTSNHEAMHQKLSYELIHHYNDAVLEVVCDKYSKYGTYSTMHN